MENISITLAEVHHPEFLKLCLTLSRNPDGNEAKRLEDDQNSVAILFIVLQLAVEIQGAVYWFPEDESKNITLSCSLINEINFLGAGFDSAGELSFVKQKYGLVL